MAKDFIKGIGLFDSQKADSEDEDQSNGSHDNAPNSHGKEKERNEQIGHVSSTECKESLSKLGIFKARNDLTRRFDSDKQHDNAHDSRQRTNKDVKVDRFRSEEDRHHKVDLRAEREATW